MLQSLLIVLAAGVFAQGRLLAQPDDLSLAVQQAPAEKAKYEVVLNSAKFAYQIIDPSSQKTLAEIPSAYQPASDDPLGKWALGYAKDATIYWSPDGTRVAIEEENYRFRGGVYIVDLKPAVPVTLQVPKSEIAKIVPGELDADRVFVGDGWRDNQTLGLSVGADVTNSNHERVHVEQDFDVAISPSDQLTASPRPQPDTAD